VHEAFDRLLRDCPVVPVALGIALGWSLIEVAAGVAAVVTGLLTTNDFTGYARRRRSRCRCPRSDAEGRDAADGRR